MNTRYNSTDMHVDRFAIEAEVRKEQARVSRAMVTWIGASVRRLFKTQDAVSGGPIATSN